MEWFNIDRAGLAAMLERKGKAFALFELIQNAWDSGATEVRAALLPLGGSPFVEMAVEDNSPEGWANLDDAFTMFGKSRRAGDAEKRGRFCMGEKLVLALCRTASIRTMQGSVEFTEKGRRRSPSKTTKGTTFKGEMRMTRAELEEVHAAAMRLIPPAGVTTWISNGATVEKLDTPQPLKVFSVKLPTEVAGEDGVLRRTTRETLVEVYAADGEGEVLEMGIPVCSGAWPWRLNVMQKVPLGMDRDSVTDAFRRALQVAAVNAMALHLTEEDAAKPWVSEAIGDSRIQPMAINDVIAKRFGEKAVVAVPGDPMANAAAEAAGYTVIHGGALSGDAWANLRKHALVPSTSQTFPQATPQQRAQAAAANAGKCPMCGQAPVAKAPQ
jgi:hypothetical protein